MAIGSFPVLCCQCLHLIIVAFAIIQVFTELRDLAQQIMSARLVSPTLIIIGKVVALLPLWSLSLKEASSLVEAKKTFQAHKQSC